MICRLFAGALALCAATAASAQTRPPDVQPYVEQPITYAAAGQLPILGDGSDAKGGTPPAAQLAAIDTPAATRASWVLSGGASYIQCTPTKTSPCEMKYRFTADPSHTNHDDAIRLWGQPGKAHCHQYFGNRNVNAQSTYASLRMRPASTTTGGDTWSTGYWEPCNYVTIGGKKYIVSPNYFTGYYAEASSYWGMFQPLYRGLRFVGGVNMDDPDDTKFKAAIAAANAMPGNAGRYAYQGNGFQGWACLPDNGSSPLPTATGAGVNSTHSNSFVMADGSDPWLGRCLAGYVIYPEFNGGVCWDGVNLWSPTGYTHIIQAVLDTTRPYDVARTCPQHWYMIPGLQGKSRYTVGPNIAGKPAYMSWSLSSDAMAAQAAGHAILPGDSFHFDWMNAIDSVIQKQVLSFCLGQDGVQPNTCDSGTHAASGHLVGGQGNENAPDGSRTPQVRFYTFTGTEANYLTPERTTMTGMAHGNHHGL